jgi:hypothetical protein
MSERLTISREDHDAIFAALRGIEGLVKRIAIKGRENDATVYAVWNNLDAIRLRLNRSAQAATVN